MPHAAHTVPTDGIRVLAPSLRHNPSLPSPLPSLPIQCTFYNSTCITPGRFLPEPPPDPPLSPGPEVWPLFRRGQPLRNKRQQTDCVCSRLLCLNLWGQVRGGFFCLWCGGQARRRSVNCGCWPCCWPAHSTYDFLRFSPGDTT